MDPRHQKRINTVQNLFASTFNVGDTAYAAPNKEDTLAVEVLKHKDAIHDLIHTYAPKYPVVNIAKIDLSVLQLAIYELAFAPEKQPAKVIINEAVEIAKELGNDRSFAFVNAVLGSINTQITHPNTDGDTSK